MTLQDYKDFMARVEDGKQNVHPPHYHENFNGVPEKFVKYEDPAQCDQLYARRRQNDWTLGYLAGMKKARKLLEQGTEKPKKKKRVGPKMTGHQKELLARGRGSGRVTLADARKVYTTHRHQVDALKRLTKLGLIKISERPGSFDLTEQGLLVLEEL